MVTQLNKQIVLLTFPGNEVTGAALAMRWGALVQPVKLHRFPDGETLVTVPTDLDGRSVVLVCSLDRPDAKLAPLLFAADAARELGAWQVGLVAPYLAYMRQDVRFEPGQAISSRTFGRVLSQQFDFMMTVDPHLHRYADLGEIYNIPTYKVTAAPAIADWIKAKIERPLLVGPDSESEQWTAAVADRLDAPYIVLDKIRHGDREVEVSVPNIDAWRDHTPVLLDDILSTARTMIAAVVRLRQTGLPPPICIAVHPILTGDALADLQAAGAARIVSCNTISHPTNAIDVTPLLADALWPVAHLQGQ
ncbi:ribose-phosphate pyrophosphokinase [Chitinimonas naiadis]